jgi:hypothetical protein
MSLNSLSQLISEIEGTTLKELDVSSKKNGTELSVEPHIITNLAGHYGALIVRYILFRLGVDENRIFRWRLENKYVQYQILNYYLPGCMPDTLALSTVLNQDDGVQQARKLFTEGYFLKSALGDASFTTKTWNKTHLFDTVLEQYPNHPVYEAYVIQKQMKLIREFRVHTFGRQIIPYSTFRIPATQEKNYHEDAQILVAEVLSKLPEQIIHGTLIGWDIGFTNTGDYYVIETNFTGFHPEYRRGFQTTGYVDGYEIGPIISAWLNNYFNIRYGLYISSIDPDLSADNPFCMAFELYSAIFKKYSFKNFLTVQQELPISVLIYIESSSNILKNLINYFHLVDFATKYYVITSRADFDLVSALFAKKPKVKVIEEAELFTFQQYQVVAQMNESKRKQTCCQHAARKLKEPYLII